MLGRELEEWWGRDGGEGDDTEGAGKNGLINRSMRGGRVEGRWMSTDCKRLLTCGRRKLMAVINARVKREGFAIKLCGEHFFGMHKRGGGRLTGPTWSETTRDRSPTSSSFSNPHSRPLYILTRTAPSSAKESSADAEPLAVGVRSFEVEVSIMVVASPEVNLEGGGRGQA